MMEWIGYAGSALVALSLMMDNIWRLRWINLAGAAFFVAYGLAVGAYPVALVNALIVAIDAYHLGVMAGKKDYFTLMPVASTEESLLKGFLAAHREDIDSFFPDFSLKAAPGVRCVFILRNLMPVGLFAFAPGAEGSVEILLDYVAPEYRDLKNARYLYSTQGRLLREEGFSRFRARPQSRVFEGYLRTMGFSPEQGQPGSFSRPIRPS